MKNEKWTMPEWMEKYREFIGNTGGNSIESLMNDKKTNSFNNVIKAGLIVSVHSQIMLLTVLHDRGII